LYQNNELQAYYYDFDHKTKAITQVICYVLLSLETSIYVVSINLNLHFHPYFYLYDKLLIFIYWQLRYRCFWTELLLIITHPFIEGYLFEDGKITCFINYSFSMFICKIIPFFWWDWLHNLVELFYFDVQFHVIDLRDIIVLYFSVEYASTIFESLWFCGQNIFELFQDCAIHCLVSIKNSRIAPLIILATGDIASYWKAHGFFLQFTVNVS